MIVADASTLVLLAKSECLDLLLQKNVKIVIPEAVFFECTFKKTFDALLIEKRVNEGKIAVNKIKNRAAVFEIMQSFGLEIGESESIVLFRELKGTVLWVDDGKAIRAAKILKIPFLTAPTIAVGLFKSKEISRESFKKIILPLQKYGRYSHEIIELALKEVEKNE